MDLKKLKRALDHLANQTGDGKATGFSVPHATLARPDAPIIYADDAIALMRDGLRWRALLRDPGRTDFHAASLEKSADKVLEALES